MPSAKLATRQVCGPHLVAAIECHKLKLKIPISIVPNIIVITSILLLAKSCQINQSNLNSGSGFIFAEAVAVQRLRVPDLVVIEQQPNQPQQQARVVSVSNQQSKWDLWNNGLSQASGSTTGQPEAASLINVQEQNSRASTLNNHNDSQPITFECLISFDRKKDKNLIVKWHHDDRAEPIYQWIPELNKRSIAPQFKAYISPITWTTQQLGADNPHQPTANWPDFGGLPGNNQSNQLLEAGFRLLRPSKELGGKYTCSAISAQNDDSKWKKMIVYTPPSSFRFNATRTDIGLLLATQRDRLIQPSMIGPISTHHGPAMNQLPAAYRMKLLDGYQTTISPQMYSTIDYVNVNQQRARQYPPTNPPWLVSQLATQSPNLGHTYSDNLQPTTRFQGPAGLYDQTAVNKNLRIQPAGPAGAQRYQHANGVKLVCDIDQVFPVPEVSIYRLAKLDSPHHDKLAKLDTQIERNPVTGLYHVQVTSILEDDELQMKYGLNEPVYFECLIALTNLELGKYSDNKRSIIYQPGSLGNSQLSARQSSGGSLLELASGNAASSSWHIILSTWKKAALLTTPTLVSCVIYHSMMNRLMLA